MDISTQILIFVKVVENKSISAAARAIGQTPSAVSKQIGRLEDKVAHRLLHRTPTGVSLTVEGREFYEKCVAVAEKIAEAEAHISSLDGAPRGQLKITSAVAFGNAQLIPILPDFLAAYPEIRVSLELTDRRVNLEEEDIDAAVCFVEQLGNPYVIARKIMANERILCAAPDYLARRGTPRSFTDLAAHNCLRTSSYRRRNDWRPSRDGEDRDVKITGNFEGDSASAVYHATLAGLGIARLSSYLVAKDIAAGALVQVLPEYVQKNAHIAVTYAEKRNLSPKIRVFVDFLAARFRLSAAQG
jgi:DNA-binding transcriptional LysR family regulator